MAKRKKPKPKLTVKKATSGSKLFGDRISGGKVDLQGYTFHYRALPNYVEIYAVQQCRIKGDKVDGQALLLQYVKWGVEKVTKGGKPFEYETEKANFMGEEFSGLAKSEMDAMPADILWALYNLIYPLTHISEVEKQSLDFTTPSETAKSTSDAQSVPTSSNEAEKIDHAGT